MTDRPRRLRLTSGLRSMVRETALEVSDLIAPMFVTAVSTTPRAIPSMPGVSQLPVDLATTEAVRLVGLGLKAVLLFGIPAAKDPLGSGAYADDGVIQETVRRLKRAVPELVVVTDVCLCEYTDHGHCGVVNGTAGFNEPALPKGYVLNDPSVSLLGRIARSHAEAGADVVAPSAMLDGMVAGIRRALDQGGFGHVPIMSYSAKYASGFYGPFRDAAEGAPKFGDRATHQMDAGNVREAMLEHTLDIAEGADFIMVKPALAYLDVVRATRDRFPEMPLVAYNVSGEYAMVKAAAQSGWLDERRIVLEVITAMRRAGADLVITYHAADVARWLNT